MNGKTTTYKLGVGRGWTLALWVFSIGLVSLFAERAVRPVRQLRVDPPVEFLEAPPQWNDKQRQAEERLARAYWECAVTTIQWKYPLASALPDDPAPEFKLNDKDYKLSGSEGRAAMRQHYWRRLQKVWPLPQAWEKKYTWDPYWLFRGGGT